MSKQCIKKESNKKMEVVLPVNEQPIVRGLTYYAYPLAIISNECVVGKVIARVNLKEYGDNGKWRSKCKNMEIEKQHDILSFCSIDRTKQSSACLYCHITNNSQITLTIEEQQYTNPWGSINVFLTDLSDDEIINENKYIFRIGKFVKDGYFLRINGENFSLKTDDEQKYSMQIEYKNENVYLKLNLDSSVIFVKKISSILDIKRYKIGVNINSGTDTYFPWLFSNFIQLRYDSNSGVPLDYVGGQMKDWDRYFANYFLDYHVLRNDELKKIFPDTINFFIRMLSSKFYIEIYVDEYYINTKRNYKQKHHYHPNLIYGFSDEKKIFFMLGIADSGYLEKQEITYDSMLSGLDPSHNRRIKIIKYNQDYNTYKLNYTYIKMMFSDYFYGVNSMNYLQCNENALSGYYGLKIYNGLSTSEGIYKLTYDVRVSYILWEHKIIMKERILYFVKMGVIDRKNKEILLELINVIISHAEKIKYITLKKRMKHCQIEAHYEEKIRTYLEKLKAKEYELLQVLKL